MRIRRHLATLALILSMSWVCCAQTSTANHLNAWFTYGGNHKIKESWSIHTLYSCRRHDFVKDWHQNLVRFGLNYHVNESLKLTPGYDWVVTYPYGKQPLPRTVYEHRITQQALVKQQFQEGKFVHRIKLEQRFLSTNYQHVLHRFRYRLNYQRRIGKQEESKWFAAVFDEIFLHYGKVGGNYFDQNWIFGGIGYKLGGNNAINLGYMNQFISRPNLKQREINHTITMTLKYSIGSSKN